MDNSVIFTISAILFAYTAAMVTLFMKQQKTKNYSKAFWLKGAAGLGFLITASVMLSHTGDALYGRYIVIGLGLGFLGDELLALRFVYEKYSTLYFTTGAGFFAVGHIFYLYAMTEKFGFSKLAIALELIGLAAAVVYALRAKTNAGGLTIPGGLYIALVTFMGAVAVSNAITQPSAATVLLALGGIGFAVSDNLLCGLCFGEKNSYGVDVWIHITYYLAQLCIAWSIFFA